jgi:hypothetical protein
MRYHSLGKKRNCPDYSDDEKDPVCTPKRAHTSNSARPSNIAHPPNSAQPSNIAHPPNSARPSNIAHPPPNSARPSNIARPSNSIPPHADNSDTNAPTKAKYVNDINVAYKALAKTCSYCWCSGKPSDVYTSHTVNYCKEGDAPSRRNVVYPNWRLRYKFPKGSCFGCGMPQKVFDLSFSDLC